MTALPASLPFGESPHPHDVGQIVVDLGRLLFCVCPEVKGVGQSFDVHNTWSVSEVLSSARYPGTPAVMSLS